MRIYLIVNSMQFAVLISTRSTMKSTIGCHYLNHLNLNPKNNLNPNNFMSTYQKKEGDISVFTNQSDNANAPSWKGNLLLNGIEYQVALWRKQGAKGEFLAGNVQVKQQPSANSADYYAGKPNAESHNNLNIQDNGNDLPF